MALFNRQNNSDIPPELQPYYDAPPAARKNWLSWIIRGVAFVVLIAVIAVLVRWSWHEARGNAKDTAPNVSTSQASSNNSSKNTDKKSAAASNSADSSSTKPQSVQTAPSTSSTSTPPKNQAPAASTPAPAAAPASQATLTNTGPGSMLTMVTIAVLGGVVLYQYALRTKLKD